LTKKKADQIGPSIDRGIDRGIDLSEEFSEAEKLAIIM
jgi:hypothetical protein